jgi:hypothetical protein
MATEKSICRYSGCQKNVAVFRRFFLQSLIPQFRNSEHYYEKRYKLQLTSTIELNI